MTVVWRDRGLMRDGDIRKGPPRLWQDGPIVLRRRLCLDVDVGGRCDVELRFGGRREVHGLAQYLAVDRGGHGLLRFDLLHQREHAVVDGAESAAVVPAGGGVGLHLEAVTNDARHADVDVVVGLDDVLPQRFVVVALVLERDVALAEQFVHPLLDLGGHGGDLGRDGGGSGRHVGVDAHHVELGERRLFLSDLAGGGPVVDVLRDLLRVPEVDLRPLVVLAVVLGVRLHRLLDQHQLRRDEAERDDLRVALLRRDVVDAVERGSRFVERRLFLLVETGHVAQAEREAERVRDRGEGLDRSATTERASEDRVVQGRVVGGGLVVVGGGDGTDGLRVGVGVHDGVGNSGLAV